MMPLCTTARRSVAWGCAFVSVGRPCVAHRVWPMPIVPASGSRGEPRFEIAQLALGAPARQLAMLQRGHPRGIVAAVFKPLERIDEQRRNRLTPENADNSAHASSPPEALR